MKFKIKIIFVSSSRVRNNARASPFKSVVAVLSVFASKWFVACTHAFQSSIDVFTVVVSIIIIFFHTFGGTQRITILE